MLMFHRLLILSYSAFCIYLLYCCFLSVSAPILCYPNSGEACWR